MTNWPAGNARIEHEEQLLLLGITEIEHARRVRAFQDLADLGIRASPADCEAWIAAPAKLRRKLMETYLVWKTSYVRM
jgi:hypothetical protein